MKLHLLARSSALVSMLLHARTTNAHDGSAKVGRSLDGIFQDPTSEENGSIAVENDIIIEESSTENSTIIPAIIGGNDATFREYPVSSYALVWLTNAYNPVTDLFLQSFALVLQFFIWLGICGGSLVAPNVVSSWNEPSKQIYNQLS
jgi:hypothetical protein